MMFFFRGGQYQQRAISSLAPTTIKACNGNLLSHTALDIYLYGDVTIESCLTLQKNLKKSGDSSRRLQQLFDLEYFPPLSLHIQSDGGLLTPALHVCDFIQNFQIPIHTYVEGSVASASSLIAVCGDKRFMTKRSTMLIHQPTTQLGYVNPESKSDEFYNVALLYGFMLDIYKEHSNLGKQKIEALIRNERRYIDAHQCLQYGLIDKIL